MKPDPLTESDQLVAAIIARHGNVVVDLLNYDHEKTPLSISLFESDGPLYGKNPYRQVMPPEE